MKQIGHRVLTKDQQYGVKDSFLTKPTGESLTCHKNQCHCNHQLLSLELKYCIPVTKIRTWAAINCFRPSTVIPLLRTPLTVGKRGSSLQDEMRQIRGNVAVMGGIRQLMHHT